MGYPVWWGDKPSKSQGSSRNPNSIGSNLAAQTASMHSTSATVPQTTSRPGQLIDTIIISASGSFAPASFFRLQEDNSKTCCIDYSEEEGAVFKVRHNPSPSGFLHLPCSSFNAATGYGTLTIGSDAPGNPTVQCQVKSGEQFDLHYNVLFNDTDDDVHSIDPDGRLNAGSVCISPRHVVSMV